MKERLNKIFGFVNLKRWVFLGIGILSLLIRMLLNAFPAFTEKYYAEGFFKMIRWCFDLFLTRLPFSLFYLFVPLCIIWVVYFFRKNKSPIKKWPFRILNFFINLICLTSLVLAAFLVFWGYNYCRIPFSEKIGLERKAFPLSHLKSDLETRTLTLIQLRQQFKDKENYTWKTSDLPKNLQDELSKHLRDVLIEMGYSPNGNVKAKILFPKGILLRNSVSGFYFPFTGEGHLDAGLHPAKVPFTTAHEMAHGYGFTDEGVCNFLGYLTCIRSDNPMIRYSGHITFWRQVAVSYKKYEREDYAAFRKNLPAEIIADLDDMNRNILAYPDFFPGVQNKTYEVFLKSQGVKEGTASYGKVVDWVFTWENQKSK